MSYIIDMNFEHLLNIYYNTAAFAMNAAVFCLHNVYLCFTDNVLSLFGY